MRHIALRAAGFLLALLLAAPVDAQRVNYSPGAAQDLSNAALPDAALALKQPYPFPGTGDAVTTTGITATTDSTTFGGLSLTSADVGKAIVVPGIGTAGAPHKTTIASPTTFAVAPPYSTGGYYATGNCDVATAGGAVGASYNIGDTIAMDGGTLQGALPRTQCTVVYTKITAATVASGGSGGADGACTLENTDGTSPAKARISGTVTGGVFGGPLTIDYGGAFSVNPTLSASSFVPSTGCAGLTGVTLDLGMGVYNARRSANGVYSISPIAGGAAGTGTVSQGSSSGSGTGFQATLAYKQSGDVTYGTDNASALTTIFALTKDHRVHVPKGSYLTTSCAQMNAAANLAIGGDGPGLTKFILADECVFPSNGWWTWITKDSGSVRDLTIDLRHALRNTLPRVDPLRFNGTLWDVQNVRIINGTTRMNLISGTAGSGRTITTPLIRDVYLQLVADVTENQCIALATAAGTISKPRLSGVQCVGTGAQLDGTEGTATDIEASGFAFGTGIFMPATSSKWTVIGAKTHDGVDGFDFNQAAAGGIENLGSDNTFIGLKSYDNGGAGFVNFGAGATCLACEANDNGGSLGIHPILDFKVNSGFRSAYSTAHTAGTLALLGSKASGSPYGYSEDNASGQASTLKGNDLTGTTAKTNILVPGTTVDAYETMTVGGLKLPYVQPVVASGLNLNPTGTASTSLVMAGLAGSFTPRTTGRMRIEVCGSARNNIVGDGALMQLRYGTGTAPANGAAVTGTAAGTAKQQTSSTSAALAPFCLRANVTGLTVGTPYWLDVTFRNPGAGGGTATLSLVDWWANEF